MKLRRFLVSASALVLMTLVSPAAYANSILTDGNFAAIPIAPGGDVLGLVGTDVPGWFIPASDGVYPWALSNGAYGVSIPGGGVGGSQLFIIGETGASGGAPHDYSIQQTMSGLVPGDTYNLTFDIASEEGCCSVVQASFLSGSSTSPMSFTAPSSGDYWTAFGAESMTFVATSSNVTLQFKDLAVEASSETAGADVGLTNVSVTGATSPVPEPSSLLLFGTGLLGVVGAARRKWGLP